MNSQQHDHDRLIQHGVLAQGTTLMSRNHAYFAVLREDGEIVVYVSSHFVTPNIIWQSKSQSKGVAPFRLTMQEDGNLVIYDAANKATWASDTWKKGSAPYKLVCQDDGNLVLYDGNNNPTWATNSERK